MEWETTLHILVEGFRIFGVEFQVWMPITLLIVAAGVVFAACTKPFPPPQAGRSQKTKRADRD